MGHLGRLAVIASALLTLAGAGAFFSALRLSGEADERDLSRADPFERSTDQAIARLQTRAGESEEGAEVLTQLGFAYLLKAREDGDPAFYSKADGVFTKALGMEPDGASGLLGASAVALARHDFQASLERADEALAVAPGDPDAFAARGDALVELGRYEEGREAYQQMLDSRPDVNAYIRVAYLRELHGDIEGAIETTMQAIEAARPNGETTAWARVQLANLYFSTGDLGEARSEYEASLEAFPGYVHALAGLGRVTAAHGDYEDAIDLYNDVVTRQPILEYIVALGEVHHANGNEAEAQRQYDLAGTIASIYKASGISTDLEMALFKADHPSAPASYEDAVTQARAVHETQPGSVRADDAFSWALYQAGRFEEALVYSQQALRLGTEDPLMLFHAGMVNYRLGNNDAARDYLGQALERNPRFSLLHGDTAREALDRLESSVYR
jgi:tetratricopeptide (TPR) repeat protein